MITAGLISGFSLVWVLHTFGVENGEAGTGVGNTGWR